MQKNNKKKKTNAFVITIIILAIAIIALLVYNMVKKEDSSDVQTLIDTKTGQIITGEKVELYTMSETERIKYYFNVYLDYLDKKDYQSAYNMLDDKFKNNYFKTLDEFTQYVSSKYSPILSVEYNDLTRMGNYYILDVTFLDLFSSTSDNMVGKNQKFIIYETDYDKYTMAFQAE